jgi:hypothetical protein
MKVSKETLAILKSFASINPVMYFGDPQAIKVIEPFGQLIGIYKTPEQFDKECAFWETPSLLAVIDQMGGENTELEFNDKFVKIISDDKASVKYMYTPEVIILKNNPKPKPYENYCKDMETDFNFEISSELLQKVIKLAKIMNLSKIEFKFENGIGKINMLDADGKVGHNYEKQIAGEGSGSISFYINNLNIIHGNYKVFAKTNLFAKWVNNDIPLFYIAGAKKE